MALRKSFRLNTAIIRPAFLLTLLVVLISALSVLPAYASEETSAPAKPTGFVAKSGAGAIALRWKANTELDLGGYNIYRNTTSVTVGAKLASAGRTITSYEDTSAAYGTTYYYWLSAVDTETPAKESLMAGPVSAILRTSFKDITNAHWARDYIEELLRNSIITGYSNGTFLPASNVTRAEFAKMVCKIMVSRNVWLESTKTTSSFSDGQSTHWAFKYIETTKKYGVMVGYKNGNDIEFRPDKRITRAEIAKIISAILSLGRGENKLRDVSKHWAREHINACVKAGIVGGYKNGNFEPNSFATRAEACKMLVKMMKLLDVKNSK